MINESLNNVETAGNPMQVFVRFTRRLECNFTIQYIVFVVVIKEHILEYSEGSRTPVNVTAVDRLFNCPMCN